MEKNIINEVKILNFIDKLSKKSSFLNYKWLNTVLKNYLFTEHNKTKIISEENNVQNIHVVLNKEMKNEVNKIMNFIDNLKFSSINILDYNYDNILQLSNFKNLVFIIEEDFYVLEINDKEEKQKIFKEFSYSDNLREPKIYKIVDKFNNFQFYSPYTIKKDFNRKDFFSCDRFLYNQNEFPKKALRNFYRFLNKNYQNLNLENIFHNYILLNQVTNEKLPLSLWEDDGVLNQDLEFLEFCSLEFDLPKNLTINRSLFIANTKVTYLGNGLTVKNNIYAENSQLAVIDDTVNVDGKIYSENSLLMSYPFNISNKIVDPKKIQETITSF
jgi:hypothetical protein